MKTFEFNHALSCLCGIVFFYVKLLLDGMAEHMIRGCWWTERTVWVDEEACVTLFGLVLRRFVKNGALANILQKEGIA